MIWRYSNVPITSSSRGMLPRSGFSEGLSQAFSSKLISFWAIDFPAWFFQIRIACIQILFRLFQNRNIELPHSIVFESNLNAIVFKKDLLETALLQPNRRLLASFENHAEIMLKKYLASGSYTKRATCIVIENIQGSIPSIKTVANHMALSVRGLQMKLKEEGTTYTELLKKIRMDLSKEYLKENQASVSEISYLLGFSDSSVFHHFFKK